MQLVPTIGLEIHVELKTKSKMFCSCPNDPDEKRPNYNICPVCLGHPGTLPVANKEAIKYVVKAGLALNCHIAEYSKFDRKNYFYPDLPKGYQISQYDQPLCKDGFLDIEGKRIRIERIHLEEDTGRLIHPQGADYSLVDYNRAGIPLMELVTKPDISSGKEARLFAESLRTIFRYIGISNADMEKGEMRVEVNISLKEKGSSKMGTKVELKNINSFRAVEKATEFEIKRQKKILEQGDKVIQETRGWRPKKGITVSQRIKEGASDYRYFPEPDLPIIHLTKEWIDAVKSEIPELPPERRKRFQEEYGLPSKTIDTFVTNKELGDYYEEVMSELREWVKEAEEKKEISEKKYKELASLAAGYISSDLEGLLNEQDKEESIQNLKITPENFAELMTLLYSKQISSRGAKDVLKEMFRTGADPPHIIKENNLLQVSDESKLKSLVDKVIQENNKAVADFKKGKTNVLQFLIGKVMALSRGSANPDVVRKLLEKELK